MAGSVTGRDDFQRSVLREVVIIRMRRYLRFKSRFRPVRGKYW